MPTATMQGSVSTMGLIETVDHLNLWQGTTAGGYLLTEQTLAYDDLVTYMQDNGLSQWIPDRSDG